MKKLTMKKGFGKAKKGTHKKGLGTAKKTLRNKTSNSKIVLKIQKTNKIPPEIRSWDTETFEFRELGPLYLRWGKKKERNRNTGKADANMYIKDVHIWVKWKKAFPDLPNCYWSAEPQHMFPPSCKSQTDEIMAKKLIWPPVEKTDPNYKQKIDIIKRLGYSNHIDNPKHKYELKDPIGSKERWSIETTSTDSIESSDASGMDAESADASTDFFDEEEDEV